MNKTTKTSCVMTYLIPTTFYIYINTMQWAHLKKKLQRSLPHPGHNYSTG